MYNRTFVSILLFAALLISGCGYHFSASSPIVLPRGQTLLYFGRVDNPTQQVWLTPYVKSMLRDEFTRRGQVTWVRKNAAETLVRVKIKEFNSSDSVKGEDDVSVKYSARVVMQVEMYDRKKGGLLWSSGWTSGSESFYSQGNKNTASRKAVDDALRKIADKLGDNF